VKDIMPTPFTTTRRVEFGDTDMAGIMHFANFFRFMESAETEFLRTLGFSVHWNGGSQRWGLPRVAASCDYKKPARFEDVLTIAVTIERLGAKSISYRHDFTNQHGDLLAVGRITAVLCRTSLPDGMESVEIPADIREKLQRYLA
jgi:YbgC/YbaW family acyl-CoA thioester hydrolase